MDQTLVEIIVGGEDAQKSFNLHKDLLCYHSRYSGKHLKETGRKAKTNPFGFPMCLKPRSVCFSIGCTLRLPERANARLRGRTRQTCPQSTTRVNEFPRNQGIRLLAEFQRSQLLLRQRFRLGCPHLVSPLNIQCTIKADHHRTALDGKIDFFNVIAQLCIFADKYEAAQIEEDLSTIFLEVQGDKWSGMINSTNAQTLLIEALPSHVPLCRWFVVHLALFLRKDRDLLRDVPREFLIDMLSATPPLYEVDTTKLIEQHRDCCHYHCHDNESDINACKERQEQDKSFCATFWRAMKEEAEASPTIEDHSVNAEE
jgi:hypothetical protein